MSTGVTRTAETDCLKPSNPYSATKAAAEMLVLAYRRTYGIEYIISRSANNYGPRQYEEKLIPKCLSSLESNKRSPWGHNFKATLIFATLSQVPRTSRTFGGRTIAAD